MITAREEEIKGTAALNIQRILEEVKKAETILEPLPALKHVQQEVIEKAPCGNETIYSSIIWSF